MCCREKQMKDLVELLTASQGNHSYPSAPDGYSIDFGRMSKLFPLAIGVYPTTAWTSTLRDLYCALLQW